MKITSQKPFPLLPHLALLALLLTLWIFVFYEVPFCLVDPKDRDFSPVGLLPFFLVPAAMVVAVLWKGAWRLAFVGTLGFLFLCTQWPDKKTPHNDDDNVIEFVIRNDTYPPGTEVFCNGVKLGEVPCKFTVRDVKEKVPRWTTPPRQPRYLEAKTPLYTWIPWDGFIRERFEARRQAASNDGTVGIDCQSEFWWSFRYKGTTAFGRLNDYQFRDNGFGSLRFSGDYFTLIYPSAYAERDVFLSVLKEDSPPERASTPPPAWTAFLAENGRLLDELLARHELIDAERPIEPALKAVARKRYGLSETPTAEECDRAIRQMSHENKRCSVVAGDGSYVSGYDWNASELFGDNYSCGDVIMYRAIHEMGDACREPLLRHCRDWKNMDFIEKFDESRLLLVLLKEHPFPVFFEEMVRLYAQHNRGATTLLSFRDPRLVGLLKTLLRKSNPFGQFESGVRSAFLVKLDNPVLEPAIRDFIAEEISIIDEEKAGNILTAFASSRRNYDWVDQEELAQWIRSLDVNSEQKTNALRYLDLPKKKENPDLVKFFPDGKSAETNGEEDMIGFSLKEVETLLVEHPDWSVEKAIEMVLHDDASDENTRRAKNALLIDALRNNMTTIVRKYWNDPDQRERLLMFIRSWYSDDYRIEQQNKQYASPGNTYWQELIRLPGSMISICRHEYGFYVDSLAGIRRENSPDYLIDRFGELDDPEECVYLPSVIRSSKKPEAKRLLEKWAGSPNVTLRKNAQNALDWLTSNDKLRNESRKLYDDLIAGRITPDEIMPPTAWIWNGRKYVTETAKEKIAEEK